MLLIKTAGKEREIMQVVHSNAAPAAIGPYSQAIKANGFVFVSGQLPIDPATGSFPEGGIREQTVQSLTNLREILKEAGSDLSLVVKTTVFLKNIADFSQMNEEYAKFFAAPCPARCAFEVAALPKDALVEIEAIAAVKAD